MLVALLIISLVLLVAVAMLSYKLYRQTQLNFATEKESCACGGTCGCGGHHHEDHHSNKFLETEKTI
jgi:hypothetical protein